ncbi:MAG: hypothetical protein ACI9TI_001498, partial [Natronomonas sp.]
RGSRRMARHRGLPAVRSLTAGGAPLALGGVVATGLEAVRADTVVATGLEAVRADTNLLVFGLLLAGCLLYASILFVDAVAEYRDTLGEDDSDSPSGR